MAATSQKIVFSTSLLLVCLLMNQCAFVKKWLPSSGASGIEKAEGVDIAVDLDEIRKLHHPPETVVTIQKVDKISPGDGGACHSAVCVVMLAVILYERLFPDRYLSVTVKQNNQIVYSAKFSTDEQFISAISTSKTEKKEFLLYDLSELGRKIVFQVAQGKPGDDTLKPVKVGSQIDLNPFYENALLKVSNPQKRGAILREMLIWFGAEALDEAYQKLSSTEPDVAKAAIVKTLCEDVSTLDPKMSWRTRFKGETDVATATAALLCLAQQQKPISDWQEWSAPTIRYICSSSFEEDARADTLRRLADLPTVLTTFNTNQASVLTECQPSPFQALLAFLMGQPVTPQAMAQTLENNATRDLALKHLPDPSAFTKDTLMAFLKLSEHRLGYGEITQKLLNYSKTAWATPAELEILANNLIETPFFSSAQNQQDILAILHQHENTFDDLTSWQHTLLKLQKKASSQNKPYVQLALYDFGDKSGRDGIIDALAPSSSTRVNLNPIKRAHPTEMSDVVANTLLLWGCQENEIEAALKSIVKQRRAKAQSIADVTLSCLPPP